VFIEPLPCVYLVVFITAVPIKSYYKAVHLRLGHQKGFSETKPRLNPKAPESDLWQGECWLRRFDAPTRPVRGCTMSSGTHPLSADPCALLPPFLFHLLPCTPVPAPNQIRPTWSPQMLRHACGLSPLAGVPRYHRDRRPLSSSRHSAAWLTYQLKDLGRGGWCWAWAAVQNSPSLLGDVVQAYHHRLCARKNLVPSLLNSDGGAAVTENRLTMVR
jgi:hypothetical protein